MADVENVIEDLESIKQLGTSGSPAHIKIDNAIRTIRELHELNDKRHAMGYREGAKDMESAKQIIIDALNREIDRLQDMTKWHYVKDGDLPTDCDNRFYICIAENHEDDCPMMLQYEEENGFGWWQDIFDAATLGFVDSVFHSVKDEQIEDVIAWMELPKFESEG